MGDLANVTEAASLAVQFDQTNQIDKAVECYRTAARLLDGIRDRFPFDKQLEMRHKAQEYRDRAATLSEQQDRAQKAVDESALQQCYSFMQQALDADEANSKEAALQLYTQAVEFSVSIKTSDPEIKKKITSIAAQALDRAEEIKGIKRMSNLSLNDAKRQVVTPMKPHLTREQSVHLKVSGKQVVYTKEEKEVLRTTSNINNNCFLPFMDIDYSERFHYTLPFEDRASELKLSSKQAAEFDCWVRPTDICSDPKMVVGDHVDCFSIRQTIVSDCSFVASLAVSALYERRFNKKIITSIIYPKNRSKAPVLNPSGKYMVKLHLNGVRRKIIIDDRLPYSRHGRLLCSYSSNKNEFWVSLLEKAYMKVMGGYDFPGSNSNIDLHALTGWIPERSAIRNGEADFNADALYEKIRTRLERGDVLVTVATGPLSDAEAERTGLVATHAYAVLDVKLANGVRLLKLKNPWSHLRWRGNYSELDQVHWTSDLRALLNYDPDSAAQFDNGVFWIDYASILRFFDVFYLNWNPDMFQYTYCIHQKWDAGTGPAKDAYNIGENPQFSLHVQGKGAVWLLLTRHITQIDDFRDNKEYITLLVYKNGGRRVYYPYDPEPYKDGIRINSPHYLCELLIGDNSADRYTLVVSQYEKSKTIFYTLRAYSTCPFTLNKLEPYPYKKTLRGEWSGRTAGGCENHRATYPNNPRFIITVPEGRAPASLVVELKGPKQYQLGVDARVESLDDPTVTAPFLKETSGPFRPGFVVLELRNLPSVRGPVVCDLDKRLSRKDLSAIAHNDFVAIQTILYIVWIAILWNLPIGSLVRGPAVCDLDKRLVREDLWAIAHDDIVAIQTILYIVWIAILWNLPIVSLGNVFVIAAIIIERNLQNVANYLVASLAVADLMVACLVMPIGAVYEVSQGWILGHELCDMWTSRDVLCSSASILHLVAIATDRIHILGHELCDMWTSRDVLCSSASILHLVAIATDR